MCQPSEIAASPKTLDLSAIARTYQLSRRTVQRRIRALEAAELLRPATEGGGRGKLRTYPTADVRRHFRQRSAPPPAAGEMPEPIAFSEWCAQWRAYREWQAGRSSDQEGARHA